MCLVLSVLLDWPLDLGGGSRDVQKALFARALFRGALPDRTRDMCHDRFSEKAPDSLYSSHARLYACSM